MHRVHVGRTLLVGVLCWGVALLGSLLPNVNSLPPPLPALIPPAAALLVTLIVTFLQAAIPTSRSSADAARPRGGQGLSVVAAVVTIVVILGLGGLAASLVARTAIQRSGFSLGAIPGVSNSFEESAVERLSSPQSGRSGDLTLSVTSVKQGDRTVRADVTITNSGNESVSLPLYGNCTLASVDGTTLNANSFESQWSTSIAGGGKLSGVIVFEGILPLNATKAQLSFATVFRLKGGSATVNNLSLLAKKS